MYIAGVRSTFKKYLLGILFVALAASFTVMIHTPTPASADGGFNAGHIIDDSVFINRDSMGVVQIQQFLNSKVPVCDTYGSQPSEYGGGTRSQWAQANYGQSTFTCLKDYSEGGRSAAQIIYDTSQSYSINPQVLIVLLQKEQGLVTDTWPLNIQYRSATGYGCPDTAACDSQYYGLTNQITWSAKMFRAIMNASPTWYTPYILGNNYIQYNPNASCGGTTVNITNRATQALYNYTPYQPNPATLAAPMGTTVTCGAYGNLNFYRYFVSWFGDMATATSTIYIPTGVYSLQNVNSGKYLNVAGANPSPGTKIQLYTNDGTASNSWLITRDSDGYYTLQNIATGNYLDVTGGNFTRGTRLQTWPANGTCSQKWAAVYQNGSYEFLNRCSGLAVDVAGGGVDNGTPIQIWSNNATPAQSWNLITNNAAPVADGFYSVTSQSSMALDIVNAQTANGTGTQIYTPNGDDAQVWQLVRQNDGTYSIRNPVSNRYLSVANGGTTAGSSVQIRDIDTSCAWKWIVVSSGSGFNILSACSAMALDITGGAVTTVGTPIQVWLSNGTGSQQWSFTPLQSPSLPSGTYSIKSTGGLTLDITGANFNQGTKLQLWWANGTGSQQWQFVKQSDGTYSIFNPGSSLYLDLTGGSLISGTRAQIWGGNNTCVQRWNVVKNTNSTYTFSSACTSLSLDATGGNISTLGTPIQAWAANGTGSQQWLFGNP